MLGTSTTPYDLRFRLLDIPVRVHPLFWLVTAFLGWTDHNLPAVLVWVGCVFVSILVHEYGHGLMARHFHGSPSIVLYGLGGLCQSQGERTSGQRLAVLLCGPGAGFLLFGLVLLASSLTLGITVPEHLAFIREQVGLESDGTQLIGALSKMPSVTAYQIYSSLIFINLWWGLVNLLPIWPLDGGQSLQVVLSHFNRGKGVRQSHIVSLVTAGILFVWVAATHRNDFFLAIFFGMFAILNYQVLHSLHQAQTSGLYHDDDWWRK